MIKNALCLALVFMFTVSAVDVSLQLEKTCSPLPKDCIQVYEFCDFVGKSTRICGNLNNIAKLNFGDEVRSVRVGPDTTVLTYEKPFYKVPNFYIHQDERCIENEYSSSFEFNVDPEEVFNYRLRHQYNLWVRNWRLFRKSYGAVALKARGDQLGIVIASDQGLSLSNYYEVVVKSGKIAIYKKSRTAIRKVKVCSNKKGKISLNKFNVYVVSVDKHDKTISLSIGGNLAIKCSDKLFLDELSWVSFSSLDGDAIIKNVTIIDFRGHTRPVLKIRKSEEKKTKKSKLHKKFSGKRVYHIKKRATRKSIKKIVKKVLKRRSVRKHKKHLRRHIKKINKKKTIRRKITHKKVNKHHKKIVKKVLRRVVRKVVKRYGKKVTKKQIKKIVKKIIKKKHIKKYIKNYKKISERKIVKIIKKIEKKRHIKKAKKSIVVEKDIKKVVQPKKPVYKYKAPLLKSGFYRRPKLIRKQLSKKRCLFDWKRKWSLGKKQTVSFKAYGPGHVGVAFSSKFHTTKPNYEIIIGAKKNTISYIKKNGKIICSSKAKITHTKKNNNYIVRVSKKGKFTVLENGKVKFSCTDKSYKNKQFFVGFSLKNVKTFYSGIKTN